MTATQEKTRLVEKLENLVRNLETFSKENEESADKRDKTNAAQDWSRGLDQGSASAYKLAAQWLREVLSIERITANLSAPGK